MRTRLFAVCSSLALAPLPVFAQAGAAPAAPAPASQSQEGQSPEAQSQGADLTQSQDENAPQDQQDEGGDQEGAEAQGPAENQGTDVAMPSAPAGTQGKESAPGQVHTVVRGDTLWDLSEQYLGTPWYWPKVWSYNPQIANPHWIYPGNQIRFYPAGQENAARVAVASPQGQNTGEVAPAETMDENGGGESGVQVAGRIGFTAPQAVHAAHEGFVTPQQIAESGTIAASPNESLMLSYPDLVYVTFRDRAQARVGEVYPVFRTVKEIDHPITGKSLGYLTEIIGKIRVVKLGDQKITAQIVGSSDEINRGDKVGPAGEQTQVVVSPKPNSKQLTGYVVSAMVPYLTLMGEETKIIVDRGSADGVEPGNTFTVIRQSDPKDSILDPAGNVDKSLPVQDIATCMAITVKEHASTCLLTRSLKEVVTGDRLVMQPGNMQVGLR